MKKKLTNIFFVMIASLFICSVMANPNLEHGRQLFQMCAPCHGQSGEGNPSLNAPANAGQSKWYVQQQLNNFRASIRGAHPKDTYGRQMISIAGMLKDTQSVIDVSAFIETLPLIKIETTLTADINGGESAYAVCASCHGAKAEGIAALNAPRLSHQHDWYIARQIRNFKQGIRGTHAKDFYGSQMRSMASVLSSDQKINDVAAYISTLD